MTRPIKLTKKELERFWQKIQKRGPNECWEWTGAKDRDGYGIFSVTASKQYKVHRVACFLSHGKAGKMTCHTCNNPSCCNPRHLYPGDAKKNSKDRDENGTTNRGGKHHLAKLTNKQVKLITKLIKDGKSSQEIADHLNCKRRLVERIQGGECWSWLTGFPKKVY